MCKNANIKNSTLSHESITAPCGQDTIPYGSKPLLWKIIVYSNYCWGKKEKKPQHFTVFGYTYIIKLTFVSFFSFFLCTMKQFSPFCKLQDFSHRKLLESLFSVELAAPHSYERRYVWMTILEDIFGAKFGWWLMILIIQLING